MAIIWMDGFDHYGTNGGLLQQGPYASAGGVQFGISANAGPGGIGHAVDMGINGAVRKVLPGLRDFVGVGLRVYAYSLPQGSNQWPLYRFRTIDNNIMATLWVLSTGALELRVGADPNQLSEALIYRTDPVIVAQSWQHVECRITASAFAIGIDSVTIVDLDGVAGLAGFADCAQISVEKGGGTDYFYKWRDLYIWDNTGTLNNDGMQGDRQIITSFPTADGPEEDWACSTGAAGWALISNNPPNDAQYIYANAADQVSNFEFADIDTDITSISAIQVVGRLKKSDAGIGTMQFEMDSDGTIGAGTEKALSTDFSYYSSIFETDPDTDLKWTPAGVNAALVQVRRVE